MKKLLVLSIITIIVIAISCKKDEPKKVEYLSLTNGLSAFTAYEELQDLYISENIINLLARDSFSSIYPIKNIIPLYYDLTIQDSIHADTMQSFEFQFANDTLQSITLLPSLTNISQWPTYQVSTSVVTIGINQDEIYDVLEFVQTQDTNYKNRLNKIIVNYKDLNTRFSSNMYQVDTLAD